MKPLLFLDFDGVLNQFQAPFVLPAHLYEQTVAVAHPWRQVRVTLNREHPAMLSRLRESFDLVWGTAWQDNANGFHLRRMLGIEELPVVRFTQMPVEYIPQGLHWKTERLLAWAKGRPFCWIDDEAQPADQAYLDRAGATSLIVFTEPVQGLQERHVQAAERFAASLAAA